MGEGVMMSSRSSSTATATTATATSQTPAPSSPASASASSALASPTLSSPRAATVSTATTSAMAASAMTTTANSTLSSPSSIYNHHQQQQQQQQQQRAPPPLSSSASASVVPTALTTSPRRTRPRRRRRRASESSIGSSGILVKSEHVGMDISAPDEGGEGFDVDDYGCDEVSATMYSSSSNNSNNNNDPVMGGASTYDAAATDVHRSQHAAQMHQPQPQPRTQPRQPHYLPQHTTSTHEPSSPPRDVTDDSEESDRSTKTSRQQQQQKQKLTQPLMSESSSPASSSTCGGEHRTVTAQDQEVSTVATANGHAPLKPMPVRTDDYTECNVPSVSTGCSGAQQRQDPSVLETQSTVAQNDGGEGVALEEEEARTSERPSTERRVQWGSPKYASDEATDEMSSSSSPLHGPRSKHQNGQRQGEGDDRDVEMDVHGNSHFTSSSGCCAVADSTEVDTGDESGEERSSTSPNHRNQQHPSSPSSPVSSTAALLPPARPPSVESLDISYTTTPSSLRLKDDLLSRLSLTAPTGRIQVIDLSRRGLTERDAELISATMRGNPQLAVLKLGYNSIGDKGAAVIASSASTNGRHHQNLTVLDFGFNDIGDEGCTALSVNMLAGNHTLRNLFLSGNQITGKGAVALAGAILHGCSLSRLHLSANKIGTAGIKVLAQAIAESESRAQQLLQRQGGIKLGYTIKPVTLEELHVSDVGFDAYGCSTMSSMIMTNSNLTTLALANNNIDDRDMALLSQALAQNKTMPVKSLILSFNQITCVGVECLMNAIWGSATLREIKLDNNKMQDRGAQLCSVVLGSVNLEVLDVSFNLITTVGIKAIMKSLSENSSLQRLGLSGISVDQNASKAVSYALAYNQSLLGLNIDSCNIGYSGQRHIVAGVVSNRNVKLRMLTGFPLGPIAMTLGLPQLPEDWGNDRVLSFIRFMWAQWRTVNVNGSEIAKELSRGPAPPSMVASSAKTAFDSLSQSDDAKLLFQAEHQLLQDECPLVAPDTAILVRSTSGKNLQVPSWDVHLQEATAGAQDDRDGQDSWSSETDSFDRSSYTGSSCSLMNVATVDHERRNKNLLWLRSHIQSLNEVGNLEFNNADLWQLHQYFYSPAYSADDDPDLENSETLDDPGDEPTTVSKDGSSGKATAPRSTPAPSQSGKVCIGRAISFQTLGKAVAKIAMEDTKRPNKRGSLEDHQPTAKRPKHLKPRIAFYPRIQEKLESLGTKPSTQTLSLLRRLKYVESVMFRGQDIYSDHEAEDEHDDGFRSPDAEMVLLDLL